MFKMFAVAGMAALVTACAAPLPVAAGDPQPRAASTARGESTAAELGFHGPVYRSKDTDGPN